MPRTGSIALIFLVCALALTLTAWSQTSIFSRDTSIINRLNYQANEAQRVRDMEKAQDLANRALDSSLQIGYQHGVATSLFIIGLTHQRTSNPKVALEFYKRAFSLSLDNHQLRANIIRNYGNCHNDLGNYDSAIVYFNKLLELATQNNLETEISRAYNNLGISYDSKGDLLLALDYYFKSLDIKTKQNDMKGMSSTFNNIGVVFYNQGDIPRAVEYFLKSQKIKEELGDLPAVANTYNNISVIFKEQKQYEEALNYLQKAIEINSIINDKRALAVCLLNQGMLFHEIGNIKEALKKVKKSLEINCEVGAKQGEINSLFSLGEIYLSGGQIDSSKIFLKKAEKLCIETGDKRNLGNVHILLAKNLTKTKAYNEAIHYAYSALTLAKAVNTIILQRDTHEVLAYINEMKGNHKESLIHYKNFITLRDTLSNNDRSKRIMQLQMQAKYDKVIETERIKQEKDMAVAQLETQRQVLVSRSFMLITFLSLIIAGIAFYHYRVNKKLSISLRQQKEEIEQQTEEIVTQSNEIENQRNLVTLQRDRIMELFTEISESVMYAQRIQQALFPSTKLLGKLLGEHFVFMRPKQVVSGDFCWIARSGDSTYVATVDCTGHGMPGAFMSMLGTTLLNELILHQANCAPNLMLDFLRDKVISTLNQTEQNQDDADGMDISLIKINFDTLQLDYAGANMPVWIVRQSDSNDSSAQLFELLPDRMPISYFYKMEPFKLQSFNLQKGDTIYMFSDGYADQFGGKNEKKFQIKQFRKLLLSISHLPTSEQKLELRENFIKWQGDNYQVDDVIVLGIRI
jgi:tetratricopeptide (TPR) repeat protein